MATSTSVKFNFDDLEFLNPRQLFDLMTAVRLYLADSDGNNAEIERLTEDPDVDESFEEYRAKIDRSRRAAARRAEKRAAMAARKNDDNDQIAERLNAEVERLDRLSDSLSNVRGDQIRFMFRQFIAQMKQLYLDRLHEKARSPKLAPGFV